MPINDIILTETQKQVAGNILETLSGPVENLLVALLGISGVGKTTLLDKIRADAEEKGVTVHDEWMYGLPYNPDNLKNGIIMANRPLRGENEIYEIKEEASSIRIVPIILKGMNEKETKSHIESRKSRSSLPLQEVIKYSLGIPDLANIILDSSSISREHIIRLAAKRIVNNLGWDPDGDYTFLKEDALRYLQISIPHDVLEALPNIDPHVTLKFDEMIEELSRNKNELARKGIFQESPFFITQGSNKIYAEMAKKLYDSVSNMIEVFAPEVKEEELEQIKEALGIKPNYLREEDNNMILLDHYGAPRQLLFDVGYEKTYVEIRDPNGNLKLSKDKRRWADRTDKIEEEFREGKLPIKPCGTRSGMFYFNRCEYADVGQTDTFKLGWMVESLLQQLRVPYITRNRLLGKDYAYIAEEQRIQEFELC